jgi:hypothetical protein
MSLYNLQQNCSVVLAFGTNKIDQNVPEIYFHGIIIIIKKIVNLRMLFYSRSMKELLEICRNK